MYRQSKRLIELLINNLIKEQKFGMSMIVAGTAATSFIWGAWTAAKLMTTACITPVNTLSSFDVEAFQGEWFSMAMPRDFRYGLASC